MKASLGKKDGNGDLPLSADFDRHARAPLHSGCLENADGRAVGIGSCGDSIEITIRLRGEIITEIGHCPKGCAFTVACASAVSALALGKTLGQALQLQPEDVERELGGLPVDHRHCARLAVNTLGEAIGDTYRQPKR
jgi:nitrogen fixation protein NifU and related proteins